MTIGCNLVFVGQMNSFVSDNRKKFPMDMKKKKIMSIQVLRDFW